MWFLNTFTGSQTIKLLTVFQKDQVTFNLESKHAFRDATMRLSWLVCIKFNSVIHKSSPENSLIFIVLTTTKFLELLYVTYCILLWHLWAPVYRYISYVTVRIKSRCVSCLFLHWSNAAVCVEWEPEDTGRKFSLWTVFQSEENQGSWMTRVNSTPHFNVISHGTSVLLCFKREISLQTTTE